MNKIKATCTFVLYFNQFNFINFNYRLGSVVVKERREKEFKVLGYINKNKNNNNIYMLISYLHLQYECIGDLKKIKGDD